MSYLKRAKDGCSGDLHWRNKGVYYRSNSGDSLAILGNKLEKADWIMENISDIKNTIALENLLASWEIYENGWLYTDQDIDSSKHLFYYLCQIGNNTRPNELGLLKKYRKNL